MELDGRGKLLRAALGFLSVKPTEPELVALHRCFDNWRATFFLSGFEHSFTSDAGSAWAPSPWEAVQRAGLDVLLKRDAPEAPPRDWTATDESPR